MKDVKKIREQLGQLQQQLLVECDRMYKLSVQGQNYNQSVQNILTNQAQIQALYWILSEEKEQNNPAPKPKQETKSKDETLEL